MIVGVDIGGTKIAAAVFAQGDGGRLRMASPTRVVPTPATASGTAVVRAVAELVSGFGDADAVTAVGVGTAGVVGSDGAIASSTDAIAGWAGLPLRAALEDAVGIEVSVLNDVHAAAVAEAAQGAGAGSRDVLMVTVGTGIGGAVVFDEILRRGETGTAGSLGHVEVSMRDALADRRCPCGGRGHVEAVASGPAMEQTYLERTGARRGLRDIAEAAAHGDAVAVEVIEEGARLLGRALASANALLDVGTIAIGGGVAEIGERYLGAVAESYRDAAMPGPARARIVAAALGVDATLTGAAITAAQR
ncbi:ROK family protein [Microbacterium paludicola]|uniref:ROK family protein n=1 Tax=Microbacterium paludicola TaxID=300019 RepID=UPI0011A88855|nr:ROK family protein [Microbacterium paludicola]